MAVFRTEPPQPGQQYRYRFGPYCLDPGRRVLLRDGNRLRLTAKSLATLVALVERAGETIPKSELLDAVWGETAVEENSLNQCISAIRKMFGERRGQDEYIVTVTGVGYRFVAPVTRDSVETPSTSAAVLRSDPPLPLTPAPRRSHLPRAAAAIAVALALACLAYAVHGFASVPGGAARRRTAVILTLKNLPGSADTAWLSAAVAEMLYHELGASANSSLRLFPPEDAARMVRDLPAGRTASDSVRDIRNYTGADYALGGTVTVLSNEAGTPVRVDLHVQDLRTGEIIATASADGSKAETFGMVRGLAERLRPTLGIVAAPHGVRDSPVPSSPRAMQLYASGITFLRASDFTAARDRLKEAVKADPSNALCYSALSAAWSGIGDDVSAADAARRAFDLSSSLDELDRLAIEGRYRLAAHDWARAAEIYGSIWNIVPDSIQDASALLQAYWESGRAREAKRVIARLRALPPPLRDDPRIDLLEAETVGATWSDFRRIAQLGGQAAEKAQRRQMRDVYARARLLQSSALYSAGDATSAAPARVEARRLCEELHDSMCVAHSLRIDANLFLSSGRMQEAQDAYNHALAVARESGNLAEQINEWNGLGLLHRQLCDFDAADRDFREALSITQEIRANTALTRNNYAAVLTSAGRLDEAREQVALALAEARSGHQVESEAYSLMSMGHLELVGGDPRRAVTLAKKAVDLAKQSGRMWAQFEIGLELAGTLAAAGETTAAQNALYAAAPDLAAASVKIPFTLMRARMSLEAGAYAEAAREAGQAADQARASHIGSFEVEADCGLALALLRLGRTEDALAAADRAMAIPQTGANPLARLDARFAVLLSAAAAHRGAHAAASFAALAAEARKSGYVQLELEIRLAEAEQAARSGLRPQALALAREVHSEATRRGYGAMAARAARVGSQLPIPLTPHATAGAAEEIGLATRSARPRSDLIDHAVLSNWRIDARTVLANSNSREPSKEYP